jgi:hypothetical protein
MWNTHIIDIYLSGGSNMTKTKGFIITALLALMLVISASAFAQDTVRPDGPPPIVHPSDIDLFTAGIAERPTDTAPCGCKTTFQRYKPTVRP